MEQIELDLGSPVDVDAFNELVLKVRTLLAEYNQASAEYEAAMQTQAAASQAYNASVTELHHFVQHTTQLPMQDFKGDVYESKFL